MQLISIGQPMPSNQKERERKSELNNSENKNDIGTPKDRVEKLNGKGSVLAREATTCS